MPIRDKKQREASKPRTRPSRSIHSTEKSLEEHGDKVRAEDKEAIEMRWVS